MTLLDRILEHYTLPVVGIHGITHWGRVLENGRRLAATTGADPDVIELFAIFHDSCRRNDGLDRDHGPRAARLLRQWRDLISLGEAAFALLVEACECHTRGARPGADTTVLTCLDADRLDIPRVGRRTDPRQLFTAAGRDPDTIEWAALRAMRRATPAVCAVEWGWPEHAT